MVAWVHPSEPASALTASILRKWAAQGSFIRFVDGNTRNCAVSNLQYVHLRDAMAHVADWKVDWDMELSAKERALVMTPEWRARLVFGARRGARGRGGSGRAAERCGVNSTRRAPAQRLLRRVVRRCVLRGAARCVVRRAGERAERAAARAAEARLLCQRHASSLQRSGWLLAGRSATRGARRCAAPLGPDKQSVAIRALVYAASQVAATYRRASGTAAARQQRASTICGRDTR